MAEDCGCGGKRKTAAATEAVIHFSDGTVSKRYVDEMSARIALGRSGKTGVVRPAPAP